MRDSSKSNPSSVFTSPQRDTLRCLFYSLIPPAPCSTVFGFQLFHYLIEACGIFLGIFLDRDIQKRAIILKIIAEHKVFRDGKCLYHFSFVVSFLLTYNALISICKHCKTRHGMALKKSAAISHLWGYYFLLDSNNSDSIWTFYDKVVFFF